ncbi:phosphatidylinositolglycan class N [Sodiomyces alkalinus F11]|uniref:GPI ethanolamine phosphate transferase 1 n=1 Tax=Sodiomyces alkalinus (strain CBS 110278 / VKM F-3762 / F11) TaxID=1314773 RepID=A0A3N2PIU1_SODAK|nr:phosphatidylinositolglycan class N [Sodiomyces alkalinus F11]ROT34467.1 phosphatidylinositolglycan class N [Sodiomyces alkalinus F11]
MALLSRYGFLAIAVVFHVVYFLSIFDIYFVSPIVGGMRLFPPKGSAHAEAPADRLVLFVGDGLRADKAFQWFPEPYPQNADDLDPRPLAPFLRSRVLHHGTFGVSHTRVPTESRPGHVALIAGLYEDVSAVATGWKLNPVNFDSVFNRSRHTWSWGSPDILPMFQQGAVPGRVDAFTYGHEFEDFSQDPLELDYWVFNNIKDFFAEATRNETLNAALRQDKLVFFLHLLGIDTSGHAYRPYSKEYLNNIKVVDKGIQEITKLMEDFYGDGRTAFVFTADHGMSDWGSHGDGHPDNTRTPLVAWGSGVAAPVLQRGSVAAGHDEYSLEWKMDEVQRHDVAQADIAALMAYLIGTEFPANSVGELPLAYVSSDLRDKAEASLVNARQILEMYCVKEELKKSKEIRFRPYGPLSGENNTAERRLSDIRTLIDTASFEEAIEESAALVKTALEGMRYFQTYDWLFLRTLITVGYLGWMAYALTGIINIYVLGGEERPSRTLSGVTFFSAMLAMLYASFIISKAPLTYYAYAFFPVIFWEEVYARRHSIAIGRRILFGHVTSGSSIASILVSTTAYLGIVFSLAAGYVHRELLTLLYLLAIFWPLSYGTSFIKKNILVATIWALSCLSMSIFTLLPANKVENIDLIMAGGVLMLVIGVAYLALEDRILTSWSGECHGAIKPVGLPMSRALTGAQVGLVLLSVVVTRSSSLSLQAKQGVPRGNLVVGWAVLVISLLMPLAHRLQPNNHYMHRLMVMFLTCAPTFVILTISYEGLFYVAFSMLLVVWVNLEHKIYIFGRSKGDQVNDRVANKRQTLSGLQACRPLSLADARVALFFFVLLQSAFFSTGNVASVSSFSLESVYRLMPLFDPFWQGLLLVIKLMIPFTLISANLGILNKRLGVAPSALFMVVMAVSDLLTLYFFWVVRDEGSWLEIGSTISHFAIASLLCVFLALLEGVSAMFIAGVEVDNGMKQGGSLANVRVGRTGRLDVGEVAFSP